MRQPPQHISAPLKHLFQMLASTICFAFTSVVRPALFCCCIAFHLNVKHHIKERRTMTRLPFDTAKRTTPADCRLQHFDPRRRVVRWWPPPQAPSGSAA